MGMTCSLHRLSSVEIDALVQNPEDMNRVLGFDAGLPVREVRPKGILGFLLRLTPITISEVDPDAPDSAIPASDPDKSIDLEKAWHGLHFLFTGTAEEGSEPACYIVKGGEDLDDEGFGRALRPEQVRNFAAFLTGLTTADLERRYDPERMTALEIYPDVIWKRTDEPSLQWLLDVFQEVRNFVKRAADAGDGVVVHIS